MTVRFTFTDGSSFTDFFALDTKIFQLACIGTKNQIGEIESIEILGVDYSAE